VVQHWNSRLQRGQAHGTGIKKPAISRL
jgi:hypothetical protein